jgi:hypothetical protein
MFIQLFISCNGRVPQSIMNYHKNQTKKPKKGYAIKQFVKR